MRQTILTGALLIAIAPASAEDRGDAPKPAGGSLEASAGSWCALPAGRAVEKAAATRAPSAPEVEPNDTVGEAQAVSLEFGPGIDIEGSLTTGEDVDVYAITLDEGDLFNGAVIATVPEQPDTRLQVLDGAGTMITTNDDDSGQSQVYPALSPLLRASGLDPTLTFVAPASGTYYIRVLPYNALESGGYTLQMLRLRPGFINRPAGERQIIFLDFNGAVINPEATFGTGLPFDVALSPLSAYLPAWGLFSSDENAVIDAILANVTENLEALRATNPSIEYELRNSRDHADPWGQPNVSRVIVGGGVLETFISAIGIAESIDPGNFEREETALVMLDLLSDPTYPTSCQNVVRHPSLTIIDVIGIGVGNIVTHEAGHYLGVFHTDPNNQLPCLMDAGGANVFLNYYETGPDELLGTSDDMQSRFTPDFYEPTEGAGEPLSVEYVDWRAAMALNVETIGCAGDLTGDGAIDGADLGLLLGAWGLPGDSDLNGDGTTDGADLGLLLGAWGPC